ncbi:MAG: MFS transporter [Gemmataceae bacterium]|nr:MFS transporter [Gemmataceae bacterium]MDW8266613.1 MFS transporter [Gemmataceae bacterium]
MHYPEPPPELPPRDNDQPWWRLLTRYHWFVLVVAALGWLFDTMDQQLFTLARNPAMTDLLGPEASKTTIDEYGAYATSIFIVGWATGGLLFGVLGDRIGRARTMMITILLYSLFTGLSALSQTFWDFALYRFLTGLGVGGEFAVGVALVAEVMPDKARPHALGWLQALSAVGNITAALINISLGIAEGEGMLSGDWKAWQMMFVIGAVPALLAVVIRYRLREPERWQQAVATQGARQKAGSMRELFGDPRWRKHTLIGLGLAVPGVVGLWGIGFFSYDFVRAVFRQTYEQQGLSPEEIRGKLTQLVGIVSVLQNIGGALGIYAFKAVTEKIGRKPAFAAAFLLAILSTSGTFWFLQHFSDVFWMIPLMGFCQLMLFGGYAIYFPELFPTRLRSTGTSFCYNVGRYISAIGPLTMGQLISTVFGHHGQIMAWRYTGVTMCSFFLIGLLVLPLAPETRGQPLPE